MVPWVPLGITPFLLQAVELKLSQVIGLELADRDTEMLSHLTLQNQIFPNIGDAEGFTFCLFLFSIDTS